MDATASNSAHYLKRNQIAFLTELFILILFFVFAWNAIFLLYDKHVSDGFRNIKNSLWLINALLVAATLIYFVHKPFRTTTTILFGIWNMNWIGLNLFLMYPF